MHAILCHLVNSAVDKNDKPGLEGHVMLRIHRLQWLLRWIAHL